jgi:hypothetical protein
LFVSVIAQPKLPRARIARSYSHFSLPFSPPLFSGRIFGSEPARGDGQGFDALLNKLVRLKPAETA